LSENSRYPENAAFYRRTACATALVCGLLLPKVAFHGLGHGLPVWLAVCIATGAILSDIEPLSIWRAIKMAMLTSGIMALALIAAYTALWSASLIFGTAAPHMRIPFGTGSIDILEPKFIVFLLVVVLEFWIASAVFISVVTLSGKRWLNKAPQRYALKWNKDPATIRRTATIILAAAGCLVVMSAAFS